MLGSLTGTVIGRLSQRILIDVHGVGYWVHTGAWQPSGEVTAFLHHAVREDVSDLYGFERLAELELFERLIGISGIGPKAALALLSLGTAERIRQAIEEKDLTFLTSAPGIGQKAAQKIVLELHNKLDALAGLLGEHGEGNADLYAALEGLGYKQSELKAALKDLPSGLGLNEQITWALKNM